MLKIHDPQPTSFDLSIAPIPLLVSPILAASYLASLYPTFLSLALLFLRIRPFPFLGRPYHSFEYALG